MDSLLGKLEKLQKELEKAEIAIVSERTLNFTSYLIKHFCSRRETLVGFVVVVFLLLILFPTAAPLRGLRLVILQEPTNRTGSGL